MSAVDRVLEIAKKEVGYLEKKSNADLYDKTANAGYNNFTKYWADIIPTMQGQPWCACFVTWCLVKAFGQEWATKLLKHYPYTYVPTLASLFPLYANPQEGDVVCFYRHGEFCHTGFVTYVKGDYFETIEGNTSAQGEIVPNGGAVCAKGYYNSNLPGTKFVRLDYSLIDAEEEKMIEEYLKKFEEIADSLQGQINSLAQAISDLNTKIDKLNDYAGIKYAWVDNNMPDWARPAINKLMEKGILKGSGKNGELNLSYDDLRLLVMLDRAGLFK